MLNADTVHVWYVFSDLVDDPRVLERYAAIMSDDERTRRDRFVRAADRHQFLVTRGMLRTLLARYLETEPTELFFAIDRYGRPSLSRPGSRIEFNVSHTRGLVACAFAQVPEIGIDVEDIERRPVSPDLARRFFSAAEATALEAVPAPDRLSRFFDYWTLKEAYLKARGTGLTLPLDSFTMQIESGKPAQIQFTAADDDDPASWQIVQFDPSRRHRLAVAVRRRGADLAVDFREFVPSMTQHDRRSSTS